MPVSGAPSALLFLLFAVLLAAAPAAAVASAEPRAPESGIQEVDVDALLARADAAYSSLASLRARFEQTIEVPLLERRRTGHGIWYQKGRGRFKMDFEDPPDDVIVADGTYLWLYYPSTHPRQVTRSTLGDERTSSGTADVLGRILQEARVGFRAVYDGREEVSGVTTDVISLRPLGRSPYRLVRIWVAVEDHLVRRFDITEQNETFRTVTLRELQPNAPLPDSLFRFVAPPGTDLFTTDGSRP